MQNKFTATPDFRDMASRLIGGPWVPWLWIADLYLQQLAGIFHVFSVWGIGKRCGSKIFESSWCYISKKQLGWILEYSNYDEQILQVKVSPDDGRKGNMTSVLRVAFCWPWVWNFHIGELLHFTVHQHSSRHGFIWSAAAEKNILIMYHLNNDDSLIPWMSSL